MSAFASGPATERLREMIEAGEVNGMLTAEQLELLRQSEQEIDEELGDEPSAHPVPVSPDAPTHL